MRDERLLRGGTVKYDFEIQGTPDAPTRLVIRVGYAFTVSDGLNDVPARLFDRVRQVWNQFEAIEMVQGGSAAPRGPVPIEFEPCVGSDKAVEIKRGPGPSNSSEYFITPDTDLMQLGAHEFGHHIGLARRYINTYGQPVTDAINMQIPQSRAEGSLTKRRLCTQPFTYNEVGLMEGAESGEDHKHDVAPRHVRHLVTLISQALGGTWEPARR